MKNKIIFLLALAVLYNASANGQYKMDTLNWNTSFAPAWINGALTGTAVNVGGSGVTTTVSISQSGGAFSGANPDGSGALTPAVGGSTYTAGPFNPPNNLMVAVDYAKAKEYTDIVITFSPAVYYLNFYMGDVDRFLRTRSDFIDQLVVEGNGKTIIPTFSRYSVDPNFPNQLLFSGDTVKVNPNANLSGNAGVGFDVQEHGGTVYVNFGSKLINNVKIRYGNVSGVISNPTYQAICISNMSFTTTTPLPVKLISFDAAATTQATILSWLTEGDTEVKQYEVERSSDGVHFTSVGSRNAQQNPYQTRYHYSDEPASGLTHYRLKMVDRQGGATYSKMITVRGSANIFTINSTFPGPFHQQLNLDLALPAADNFEVTVYGMNGTIHSRQQRQGSKGRQTVTIDQLFVLPAGQYLVQVRYRDQIKCIKAMKK